MSFVPVFSSGNLSAGEREDRSNRWVLAAFGIIGLLEAYLRPTRIARDSGRWTAIASAGLAWPCSSLAACCGYGQFFVLGRRFSGLVAIQSGHTLVTTGMYGVIRNPSYLGLLVNALGWAFAFRSGVGVLLTLLTIVPLVARIRSEEKLLHSQFGAEYDAYRARTARLIPGLY